MAERLGFRVGSVQILRGNEASYGNRRRGYDMRPCIGCGCYFEGNNLYAGYCPRCDKIAGDVMTDLKAELEG